MIGWPGIPSLPPSLPPRPPSPPPVKSALKIMLISKQEFPEHVYLFLMPTSQQLLPLAGGGEGVNIQMRWIQGLFVGFLSGTFVVYRLGDYVCRM